MKIKKENNQYYGQFFEEAIVSKINNEKVLNNTKYIFSEEEKEEMKNDAEKVAKFLKGKKAIFIGRETSKKNGDILLDNSVIEIKYVSQGSGTYFNTSVSYLEKLGFISFKDFMKETKYIDFLKSEFGDIIQENNYSPVNMKNSKMIRKQHSEFYKEIQKEDKKNREEYVKRLYEFLENNHQEKIKFLNDMISKSESNKEVPDTLIIFNHNTKKITSISKDKINLLSEQTELKRSGKFSLKFGEVRVTIAWQNGTGLNNPTIRVFL